MKPLRSSRAWEASKADSAPGQLSAPAAVSFPDEMLILVDQDGRSIGEASKQQCHEGRGLLHRAFSLLIFDQKGRLLLQQRAAGKLLWPGYWSNSCCSHPRTGEGLAAAARRRSREELGLSVDPELLFTFQYSATYRNIGSENEVCAVFAARTDHAPTPHPHEVADWRFVAAEELNEAVERDPDRFTPWFRLEWRRILEEFPGLTLPALGDAVQV